MSAVAATFSTQKRADEAASVTAAASPPPPPSSPSPSPVERPRGAREAASSDRRRSPTSSSRPPSAASARRAVPRRRALRHDRAAGGARGDAPRRPLARAARRPLPRAGADQRAAEALLAAAAAAAAVAVCGELAARARRGPDATQRVEGARRRVHPCRREHLRPVGRELACVPAPPPASRKAAFAHRRRAAARDAYPSYFAGSCCVTSCFGAAQSGGSRLFGTTMSSPARGAASRLTSNCTSRDAGLALVGARRFARGDVERAGPRRLRRRRRGRVPVMASPSRARAGGERPP